MLSRIPGGEDGLRMLKGHKSKMKESQPIKMIQFFDVRRRRGQVVTEFVFCFALVLLLFWGCILVIRWAGVSLAERRTVHDATLTSFVPDDWDTFPESPFNQVNPDFHEGTKMNLIFDGR